MSLGFFTGAREGVLRRTRAWTCLLVQAKVSSEGHAMAAIAEQHHHMRQALHRRSRQGHWGSAEHPYMHLDRVICAELSDNIRSLIVYAVLLVMHTKLHCNEVAVSWHSVQSIGLKIHHAHAARMRL